jgi:hypothetical protein
MHYEKNLANIIYQYFYSYSIARRIFFAKQKENGAGKVIYQKEWDKGKIAYAEQTQKRRTFESQKV